MTDETTNEPAEVETTDAPQPEGEKLTSTDRLPDDHPVVLALSKANEEAKQARLKVKEYEDATKTEQERLTERASELEKNLTTAEANAARFEIALEMGLTKSQAKRLVGGTREELEADAAELLADLGLDDEKPSPSRRPKERLRPGAAPDAEPAKSPQELADAVVKARGY